MLHEFIQKIYFFVSTRLLFSAITIIHQQFYNRYLRYPIGDVVLPYFAEWANEVLNVDLTKPNKPQELPSEDRYPTPNIEPELVEAIKSLNISFSLDGLDRLIRSHGHTLHDIYVLRNSFFERIPDVVVWPMCHDDVVRLVTLADKNNAVIVVFGGGTAVSGASLCPNDPRTIILLDTSQMNSILWIDEDNLTACCQSGIIGTVLDFSIVTFPDQTTH